MVATVKSRHHALESMFDFDDMQERTDERVERSASLGGFVSFAQTGTSADKKNTYPAHKWTLLKKYPEEFKLKGASMVSFEDRLIIFGGCREDLTCSNSIYSFDMNQEKLEEIVAIGDKPAPRQGHCVIAYGQEMIVFGGSNEIGVYNDLFVFDMKYVNSFNSVFLEKSRLSRSQPRSQILPRLRARPKPASDNFRRLHGKLHLTRVKTT